MDNTQYIFEVLFRKVCFRSVLLVGGLCRCSLSFKNISWPLASQVWPSRHQIAFIWLLIINKYIMFFSLQWDQKRITNTPRGLTYGSGPKFFRKLYSIQILFKYNYQFVSIINSQYSTVISRIPSLASLSRI